MPKLLTRIEIDGFKSFTQFALDLEPFQVIIGPNGVGKSNLFDALRLLSRLAETDLRSAYGEIRGESGELFTVLPDGSRAPEMSFAVELLLPLDVVDSWGRRESLNHTRVRYEIKIRRVKDERGLEQLRITHEALKPIRSREDNWAKDKRVGDMDRLFLYRRVQNLISTELVKGAPTVTLHQDGRAGRQRQSVLERMESSFLSGLVNAEFPIAFATREELREWRFLQMNPEAMRLPSVRLDKDQLDPAGRYLASVLARLKKTNEFLLTEINTDLANLVPEFTRLEIEEDEVRDRYVIWLYTSDGRRFSSRVLSDGTLRLLALAALRHDPQHRGLTCLEEPENGVYPLRVGPLVEMLRNMTTQFMADADPARPLRQLLVNTHSPRLVRELRPSEIVLAYTSRMVMPEANRSAHVTRMNRISDDLIGSEHTFSRLELSHFLATGETREVTFRLAGGGAG